MKNTEKIPPAIIDLKYSRDAEERKEQLGTDNIDEVKKAALIILQLISALLCADASFSNMINKHDSHIDYGYNHKTLKKICRSPGSLLSIFVL